MRVRRTLLGLLAAATLASAVLLLMWWANPVARIAGVQGPAAATVAAPPPAPTAPDAFAPSGGRAALALYVTDPNSEWLSLAFGLRTIGVPLIVTTDAARAARQAVVLAYPTISGRTVSAAASMALREQVAAGGTLVGFEVLGAGLGDVFGLQSVQNDARRQHLEWGADAAQRWEFSAPEERRLILGNEQAPLRGVSLSPSGDARILARFDDGSPGLLEHAHGKGRAYTLAIDAGAFIGGAQQGRREIWRDYVNAYEPTVDVLLRWIKAIYREGQPGAVTLATVPQGRPLAVVLSHDVDFSGSLRNALDYARSEARQGVRGTFFVQTKYVKDWSDEPFYDADGLALTRELHTLGGELASHSVAHSPVFAQFPLGTGDERYPSYAPYVRSKTETRRASVLGELRVSRFLLEQAASGQAVRSFRPGYLAYAKTLPQALEATGYRFSSSMSSGTALSHLPFQLSYAREGRTAVPVFEFPITLEDERVRPMDTALLPRALQVADQLARYGGLCVVLIHPNVLDDKLRFQEAFVDAMRQRQAWFGTVNELGAWWLARDGVRLDVAPAGTQLKLTLTTPQAIRGLALQLPAGWHAPAGIGSAAAHGLALDLAPGTTELLLERNH